MVSGRETTGGDGPVSAGSRSEQPERSCAFSFPSTGGDAVYSVTLGPVIPAARENTGRRPSGHRRGLPQAKGVGGTVLFYAGPDDRATGPGPFTGSWSADEKVRAGAGEGVTQTSTACAPCAYPGSKSDLKSGAYRPGGGSVGSAEFPESNPVPRPCCRRRPASTSTRR